MVVNLTYIRTGSSTRPSPSEAQVGVDGTQLLDDFCSVRSSLDTERLDAFRVIRGSFIRERWRLQRARGRASELEAEWLACRGQEALREIAGRGEVEAYMLTLWWSLPHNVDRQQVIIRRDLQFLMEFVVGAEKKKREMIYELFEQDENIIKERLNLRRLIQESEGAELAKESPPNFGPLQANEASERRAILQSEESGSEELAEWGQDAASIIRLATLEQAGPGPSDWVSLAHWVGVLIEGRSGRAKGRLGLRMQEAMRWVPIVVARLSQDGEERRCQLVEARVIEGLCHALKDPGGVPDLERLLVVLTAMLTLHRAEDSDPCATLSLQKEGITDTLLYWLGLTSPYLASSSGGDRKNGSATLVGPSPVEYELLGCVFDFAITAAHVHKLGRFHPQLPDCDVLMGLIEPLSLRVRYTPWHRSLVLRYLELCQALMMSSSGDKFMRALFAHSLTSFLCLTVKHFWIIQDLEVVEQAVRVLAAVIRRTKEREFVYMYSWDSLLFEIGHAQDDTMVPEQSLADPDEDVASTVMNSLMTSGGADSRGTEGEGVLTKALFRYSSLEHAKSLKRARAGTAKGGRPKKPRRDGGSSFEASPGSLRESLLSAASARGDARSASSGSALSGMSNVTSATAGTAEIAAQAERYGELPPADLLDATLCEDLRTAALALHTLITRAAERDRSIRESARPDSHTTLQLENTMLPPQGIFGNPREGAPHEAGGTEVDDAGEQDVEELQAEADALKPISMGQGEASLEVDRMRVSMIVDRRPRGILFDSLVPVIRMKKARVGHSVQCRYLRFRPDGDVFKFQQEAQNAFNMPTATVYFSHTEFGTLSLTPKTTHLFLDCEELSLSIEE